MDRTAYLALKSSARAALRHNVRQRRDAEFADYLHNGLETAAFVAVPVVPGWSRSVPHLERQRLAELRFSRELVRNRLRELRETRERPHPPVLDRLGVTKDGQLRGIRADLDRAVARLRRNLARAGMAKVGA